jgi:hypothetical protein
MLKRIFSTQLVYKAAPNEAPGENERSIAAMEMALNAFLAGKPDVAVEWKQTSVALGPDTVVTTLTAIVDYQP